MSGMLQLACPSVTHEIAGKAALPRSHRQKRRNFVSESGKYAPQNSRGVGSVGAKLVNLSHPVQGPREGQIGRRDKPMNAIVLIALKRPYTFVVLAILIL